MADGAVHRLVLPHKLVMPTMNDQDKRKKGLSPEEAAELARLEERGAEITAALKTRRQESQQRGDALIEHARALNAQNAQRFAKMKQVDRQFRRDMNSLVFPQIWKMFKWRISHFCERVLGRIRSPFEAFSDRRSHQRMERLIREAKEESQGNRTKKPE